MNIGKLFSTLLVFSTLHLVALNPAGFIENKGQFFNENYEAINDVLYKASTPNGDLYITKKGLSFVLFSYELIPSTSFQSKETKYKTSWNKIDIEFKDASILKENCLNQFINDEHFNYFFPHCPQGIYNVKSFKKITIKNIYPLIDWVVYINNKNEFKYDFVVHPKGDPSLIQFNVYGADVTNNRTTLQLASPLGVINEGDLYSYQTDAKIESSYRVRANDQSKTAYVKFNIGKYDQSHDLIIDPPLLWSTYMGGATSEGYNCITTDNNGDVYTVGQTSSNPFPTTPQTGSYNQGTFVGGYSDMIFSKFDNNGKLLWCSYYGSSGDEWAMSCCTDPNKNFYIAGYGEYASTLPLQTSANGGAYYRSTFQAAKEAIVIKFNSSGVRQWATFYGGNAEDWASSITSDDLGNIFLLGYSPSTTLPKTTPGVAYTQNPSGNEDVFIAEFDPNDALIWSTTFGGTKPDYAGQITIDKNRNIIIVGSTTSQSGFPLANPTGAFYQASNVSISTNPMQAFIAKFNSNRSLFWSTYIGGSYIDKGWAVTTDNNANIYAGGQMETSANFPYIANTATGGYTQAALSGVTDNWFAKFSPSGVARWITFYGGSGIENNAFSLAYNHSNLIYGGGSTLSTNFPLKNDPSGFNQASNNGGYDNFIFSFDTSGAYNWGTYFGGNQGDFLNSITCDQAGCVFATGYTQSTSSFPIQSYTGSYNQSSNAGTYNTFVSKFCSALLNATVTSINPKCGDINDGTATAVASSGAPQYNYSWSSNANNQTTAIATGLGSGIYTVTVTDQNATSITKTVEITSPPILTGSVTVSTTINCYGNKGSISSTISGGTTGYIYSWIGTGQTTANATNLNAGIYTLQVSDANNCTKTFTTALTEPSKINVIPGTTNSQCTSATGSASVNVSGGASNYTYSWSGSASTQNTSNVTGLAAGIYSVNITDGAGCKKDTVLTVNSNGGGLATIQTYINPKCYNSSDGTATVSMTGGTKPFTYSWSINTTQDSVATNLNGNTTYSVTVTDINGCKSTASIQLSGPAPVVSTTSNPIQASCGKTDGGITINTSGGNSPYTYSWQSNIQTSGIITGLAGGSYTFIISDASNCTTSITATINTPAKPDLTVSNDTLIKSGSSINLVATSTTNNVTYSWSSTEIFNCGLPCSTISSSPTISGWYRVIITDNNGCTNTDSVFVDIESPCKDFYLPTAFSPNGDNINDILYLRGNCISSFKLELFDRWGEKVFETTDIKNGWDGYYKGQLLNSAVFTYQLSITQTKKDPIIKKGNITLIR